MYPAQMHQTSQNSIDLGNVWRKMYSWRSAVLRLISCVDKIKVMLLSPPRRKKKKDTIFGFCVTYDAWDRKTSHCGTVVFKKNLIYYLSQKVSHGVSVKWRSLAIYVLADLSLSESTKGNSEYLSNLCTRHFGKILFHSLKHVWYGNFNF